MAQLKVLSVKTINGDAHWAGDYLFNRNRISSITDHDDGVRFNYYAPMLTDAVIYNKLVLSDSLSDVLILLNGSNIITRSLDVYEDANDNASNTTTTKINVNDIVYGVSYGAADCLLYVQKGGKIEKVLCNNTLSGVAPIEASDYSLWYLPAKTELDTMYTNLAVNGLGDFNADYYWSSTEYDSSNAYIKAFSGGVAEVSTKNLANRGVRACRYFTATSGYYSIGDEGPGGGLVFYIDGDTHYQAAVSDQSTAYYWSNTSSLIGVAAQGEAFGTGLTNSAAIRLQNLHVESASGLCYRENDGAASSWFLPMDTLMAYMYSNLHESGWGGFTESEYWTSFNVTPENPDTGRYLNFSNGQTSSALKTTEYRVRACRVFTDIDESYSIGDEGPGGGLVFYIDGYSVYEAASEDQSDGYFWGNLTDSNGGGFTNITDPIGLLSTADIISYTGHTRSAAYLCYFLTEGVSSVWFLPSLGELGEMHAELEANGLGGFESTGLYWSSSEDDTDPDNEAMAVTFSSGAESAQIKTSTLYVRPCRKFTSSVGTYAVGDLGPGGGYVFYVNGITNYEAADADVSTGYVWLDAEVENPIPFEDPIDTSLVEVGVGGQAIGDGFDNTYEIVAVEGHINSAAEQCLDYTV